MAEVTMSAVCVFAGLINYNVGNKTIGAICIAAATWGFALEFLK